MVRMAVEGMRDALLCTCLILGPRVKFHQCHQPCGRDLASYLSHMPSTKTRTAANTFQGDLFAAPRRVPEGFRYQPDLIGHEEERDLAHRIQGLAFKPFDFHGHLANRQVVGFGLRYDYERRQVVEAPPIPDFLLPLQTKVATFAGRPTSEFAQAR